MAQKKRYTIAITGASGNMGQAVVQHVMTLDNVQLRLLLLDHASEHRLAKKWTKQFGDRITCIFGNLRCQEDCCALIEGSDYVVNLAAVIPPNVDSHYDLDKDANITGVKCLINAIEPCYPQPKFIHISTVAVYGNRDYHHPWGRVGDPLLPSAYDNSAMSKLIGERTVLDSNITTWTILRQTGILYEKFLMNNVSDGRIFHTCFNTPIEWVTDHDSGVLIKNILIKDMAGANKEFWHKVYNIGGGAAYRTTGFETFDMGFKTIGGSTHDFVRPNWHATRNFHYMWFEDSDVLEKEYHFRSKSVEQFWQDVAEKKSFFKLARMLPASFICALVFKPLLRDKNAPYRWVKEGNEGRALAYFGGKAKWEAIGEDWSRFAVWCKQQINGHDYVKEKEMSHSVDYRLSHGYDETKRDDELTLTDLKAAAKFRGGACLESHYRSGNMYNKIRWMCADGHEFEASVYTVLKAGHWCPHCLRENEWRFDHLARNNPFYAQVWYDTHDQKEHVKYYFDKGGAACICEDKP